MLKETSSKKLIKTLICPFTRSFIRYPVITNDGHYWELSGLIDYIRHCRETNKPIKSLHDSSILITTATYSYDTEQTLDALEKVVKGEDRAEVYAKEEKLAELKKLLPEPKITVSKSRSQLVNKIKPGIYFIMANLGIAIEALKYIQTLDSNRLAYSYGYDTGCKNAISDATSGRKRDLDFKSVDSYEDFARDQYTEWYSSFTTVGGFVAAYHLAQRAGQTGKSSYLVMALAAAFAAVYSGRLMSESSNAIFSGVGYATGYESCSESQCHKKPIPISCYGKQYFFSSSKLLNDDLSIFGLILAAVIFGYVVGSLSKPSQMTISYGEEKFVPNLV